MWLHADSRKLMTLPNRDLGEVAEVLMNEKPLPKFTDYIGTEIRELFERCVQRQDSLERTNPKELAREWLFEDCKITPLPTGAADSLICQRYGELLEVLRRSGDIQAWHWLGQWLKSENIRDPLKFFPETVLKRMVQASGIEPARICNARIVRIWLPYTEPLVRRVKWRRQAKMENCITQWEAQAYDSRVTRALGSKKWNSAVEFTSEWIAEWSQTRKKKYDRDYLVTSYSKCVANSWIRPSKCSFCRLQARGEFWIRGEPIPHCEKHSPDKLPKSLIEAWRDLVGRRWWREGMDIYFTASSTSP
jgi:hypothetical protein